MSSRIFITKTFVGQYYLFALYLQFDPVVQLGNEGVVHHFIVMACGKDFPGVHLNASSDCDDYANMPAEVLQCRGMGVLAAAWGVGGGVCMLLAC